jgi:hypothetical protein
MINYVSIFPKDVAYGRNTGNAKTKVVGRHKGGNYLLNRVVNRKTILKTIVKALDMGLCSAFYILGIGSDWERL